MKFTLLIAVIICLSLSADSDTQIPLTGYVELTNSTGNSLVEIGFNICNSAVLSDDLMDDISLDDGEALTVELRVNRYDIVCIDNLNNRYTLPGIRIKCFPGDDVVFVTVTEADLD